MQRNNYAADETIALIEAIASNPEIKMLIINPAWHETDHIVSTLRQTRDDIFIVYLGYSFHDNALAHATTNANLILDVNVDGMNRAFPAQTLELGARTLVYFYDTSIMWTWGEEDLYGSNEYEESYWHIFMRGKSAEIGLQFVEVNIGGAIQCGSSYAMFMHETIPPLIEELGEDIVLFGLDNERVFWTWRAHGFIYLPMQPAWFDLTPIDLAWEMQLFESSTNLAADMPQLIDEIRKELDERGLLGRIAAAPMPIHKLLHFAAVEYGIMWVQGEVPEEGIDMNVLEQIIVELIAEYTGQTYHGVTLTTLAENGMTYENYILVMTDYLIY